jgi:hypothetical protein
VFVYTDLRRYGPEPWLVGQYFPDRGRHRRSRPADNGAIVGGATLAVAALLALLIGLSMARSIRTITRRPSRSSGWSSTSRSTAARACAEIDDAGHSSTRRAAC